MPASRFERPFAARAGEAAGASWLEPVSLQTDAREPVGVDHAADTLRGRISPGQDAGPSSSGGAYYINRAISPRRSSNLLWKPCVVGKAWFEAS